MSKKAEIVFEKLGGVMSYIKATKELPFNLKAVRVYGKEIGKERAKIRKVISDRFWGSRNLDDTYDPVMSSINKANTDNIIEAANKEIKYFKSVRKPHIKEIKKGLIIPGTGIVATTLAGTSLIKSKEQKNEDTIY